MSNDRSKPRDEVVVLSVPGLNKLTVCVLIAVLLAAMAGCQAVALAGVMADTFERTGSHKVYADYKGLEGKSFAVIIAADRVIQGNDSRAITRLTNGIIRKLAASKDVHGANGFVPGVKVLEFQYNKPRWATWSYGRLADEFGVERLIFIDLQEYRLGEPGNAYLWDGVLSGKVGVIEADGMNPDEFAYTKDIRVKYPDQTGVTVNEQNRATVQANLEDRFADRVAWLFFDHEEANMIKY